MILNNLPIGSMYGIPTYIYHANQQNVPKYTIHASYVLELTFKLHEFTSKHLYKKVIGNRCLTIDFCWDPCLMSSSHEVIYYCFRVQGLLSQNPNKVISLYPLKRMVCLIMSTIFLSPASCQFWGLFVYINGRANH